MLVRIAPHSISNRHARCVAAAFVHTGDDIATAAARKQFTAAAAPLRPQSAAAPTRQRKRKELSGRAGTDDGEVTPVTLTACRDHSVIENAASLVVGGCSGVWGPCSCGVAILSPTPHYTPYMYGV